MSELLFQNSYWKNTEQRIAFKSFLKFIHDIDLTRWEEAGYWDFQNYHPFSYFNESGQVVASVCLYSLELIIEGRTCRAAQFSGVGTHPELRRRGLSRQLTEMALEWAAAEHDLVFLFSHDQALPFYSKCGFQYVEESFPFITVEGHTPKEGLRKLDVTRDLQLIEAFALRRIPVSHRLSAWNHQLFLFHVLYSHTKNVYLLPELDLLLLLKHEGERLHLFDVVGEAVPKFEDLFPYLTRAETREVHFHFEPDRLELLDLKRRPFPQNLFHDRGDFPLRDGPFIFPETAHA